MVAAKGGSQNEPLLLIFRAGVVAARKGRNPGNEHKHFLLGFGGKSSFSWLGEPEDSHSRLVNM